MGQYRVACVGCVAVGGAMLAYGCEGTFTEKNAIVANIQATNINSKPIPNTIVNMAPTKRSVPAVSKRCSPDLWASAEKALLKYIAIST